MGGTPPPQAPARRQCGSPVRNGPCQQVVLEQTVEPKAPGAKPVRLVICPQCDRVR
ncbi:MAG TPA: hypothetical protein VHK88_20140 [Aquihabitans sp.]|nr:hypothetical protein [Aquihabitans sp.]